MKKILLVALAGAMLSLSACGASSGGASAGGGGSKTFSATEAGFGGDVTVTITVTDGALADVSIAGDKESDGYGKDALPVLAASIMEAKSAQIDVVSGSTVTSEAVIKAAEKAFSDAGL